MTTRQQFSRCTFFTVPSGIIGGLDSRLAAHFYSFLAHLLRGASITLEVYIHIFSFFSPFHQMSFLLSMRCLITLLSPCIIHRFPRSSLFFHLFLALGKNDISRISKQRGFDYLKGTRRSTEGELLSLMVRLVKGRQAVRSAV